MQVLFVSDDMVWYTVVASQKMYVFHFSDFVRLQFCTAFTRDLSTNALTDRVRGTRTFYHEYSKRSFLVRSVQILFIYA